MVNIFLAALISTSILLNTPVSLLPQEKNLHYTAARSVRIIKKTQPDMWTAVYYKIKIYNPKLNANEVMKIIEAVNKASNKYGFDKNIVYAVIATESGFNPKAKGSLDDTGLMQIRMKYARGWAKGANIELNDLQSLYDIEKNIELGTYILSYLNKRYNNDTYKTLVAYNQGEGFLDKATKSGKPIPKKYVNSVSRHYYRLFQQNLT
jgi:soluble lytic murein transglycosylase-like protein